MKTLQNNFTTPEQSKRLLELGVPADSADMAAYTFFESYNYKILKHPYSIFIRDYVPADIVKFYTPCWSVGRLMEITFECDKRKVNITYRDIVPCKGTIIERIINILEYAIECNDIDFSKLEE